VIKWTINLYLEILDRIINDRTVPKNIREAVEKAKNALNSKERMKS